MAMGGAALESALARVLHTLTRYRLLRWSEAFSRSFDKL